MADTAIFEKGREAKSNLKTAPIDEGLRSFSVPLRPRPGIQGRLADCFIRTHFFVELCPSTPLITLALLGS